MNDFANQAYEHINLPNSHTPHCAHTMYAAAVSSGSSPFEPRCATLYGREV